jgi:tol-pal system protein YbgF
MSAKLPTIRRLVPPAVAAALLSFALAGSAAVPVEESVAVPRGGSAERVQAPQSAARQQGTVDDPAASGSSTGLSGLFYELQVLQQEVQALRGMLEEQEHRLDRLARDQQEQYLDLDRRMQALRGGGGAPPSRPPGGQQAPEPSFDSGSPASGGGGGPSSEREAYAAAFDLMKERRFEASAEAFNRLVQQYPNGAYTPNAFYWLGELYLAQEENERARQSFAQVTNLYPDHQKVPDALYKLGVVYHRLGDVGRAREYLNRVRREHPDSSAAGLAQTYLAEL